MASALVNNVSVSPESFLDLSPALSSYGWLSPRISFSRDLSDDAPNPAAAGEDKSTENSDPEGSGKDLGDFEFRLEDPVAMLPADELFSDGKLVPLQLAPAKPTAEAEAEVESESERPPAEIRSPEPVKSRRRLENAGSDPYLFSPKAPRCSSRWRELLGLKKLQNAKTATAMASSAASPSKASNPKSLKQFLHRNPKSPATDSSLSLPLLRDSDSESVSISSRLSLSSSSSSGPDHEDLPRLSLDSDKPNQVPISLNRNPPKVRVARARLAALDGHVSPGARVVRSPIRRPPEAAADSPRMNASGKIVFQGLERSSSSPSSFNGGPRPRPRGMERSYSANVRVTPVLNVPVCSLRGSGKAGSVFGFGQLFSPQKKEGSAGRSTGISRKLKIERGSSKD